MVEASLVKLPWYEYYWTSLMTSQHWFRQWLGAVRQQAFTWTDVDLHPCRHMASLSHNELKCKVVSHDRNKLQWNLIQNIMSMMTSSNGNIFRVTGSLCREFTSHRWIHSPVTGEFPSQKPVTQALMFSLIYAWINAWVNNREAGDLRRHGAHYDVTVMSSFKKMYLKMLWTKWWPFCPGLNVMN